MLNKDDRVIIISACQTRGYIGSVAKIFYCGDNLCASVKLDRIAPSGVRYQCYNIANLRLTNKENNEMEEPIKCEMIDGYYIVEVKGSYNKRYSYKCRFDVNVGDKVVCEDEDYIQTVVGIYNTDNSSIKNPTKEVVCVIDYSVVNARKEREKLIAQIKRDLDAKVKQIQSKIDYDFYASRDSEVAELLNTLNELKGDK